jgi:hypothetical protein
LTPGVSLGRKTEKISMTEEQLEQIKRDAFVAGYVEACREWTSGQIAAVSAAHKAYEKRKTS